MLGGHGNFMLFNQTKSKIYTWIGLTPSSIKDQEQPCQEGLEGAGGLEAALELAAGTLSPEKQLHPGLHQQNCGQHVKRGDPLLVLHPGEIPPGVLHPALGIPA